MTITTGRRILTPDENTMVALDFPDEINRKVVAKATRRNKGTLWYVFLAKHGNPYPGRAETPHARVSGKLPEDVQRRLLTAILEAA